MHVLGYELIRPYGVCAVMLFGDVVKISAEFFPLDDGECRAQRIEFRNLDVLGILIDCFAIGECRAAADVVSLICSAGGSCDDPSERIVLPELNTHPYVDEWNTPFLQPLND